MEITRINTALVKGFGEWALVRVETDKDLCGLGETFRSLDGYGHVMETMVRALPTELIGQDPMPISRLKERLYRFFQENENLRHLRRRIGGSRGASPTVGYCITPPSSQASDLSHDR